MGVSELSRLVYVFKMHAPQFKKFYQDIRSLVLHYYPDASADLLENKIHFEYNTRLYVVHLPHMSGEWQDPTEERGPRDGGTLGEIELRSGEWQGQAVAPQTFDRKYYSILLMAPYFEKCDCHLYTRLFIPSLRPNAEFINEIEALINNYGAMAP